MSNVQLRQMAMPGLQESFLTFEDMESVSNAHTAKQRYEYTIYGPENEICKAFDQTGEDPYPTTENESIFQFHKQLQLPLRSRPCG
jgi:hypothetical protein